MKHQKLETTPEISKRMANVSLKGGKSETALAKALWHQGIRYRKNYKKLPGSPDIAITKYKIAVFVDGEFWHGEDWENRKRKLKSNREYWIEKIEENISRDERNDNLLREMGWTPMHFWEKQIKKDLEGCVNKIIDQIQINYAETIEL
jgi:DNA mismatch endonuclease (patch repair protein)